MSTQPPRGFAQAQSQAESAARDKNKTKQLLHDALNKAYRNRNQLKSVWNDLMAVFRKTPGLTGGQSAMACKWIKWPCRSCLRTNSVATIAARG